MITIAEIKSSMRIMHSNSDNEIQRNIDTALLDMSRVGVDSEKNSSLLDKACELYCKAEFDFQGKGAEYRKNYEALRDGLSLSGEYKNV